MTQFFQFEHPWILYILIPIVIGAVLWKIFLYKSPQFSYALVQELSKKMSSSAMYHRYVLYALRAIVLGVLALLIAKPGRVDIESKLPVEGIDIMIVLDVSGSMNLADFAQTKETRFQVAKTEAIRFIEKRDNDAMGLILFAKNAISRCPLTLDRNLLQNIIQKLQIGDINSEGTMLTKGIVAAANRLRYSDSKTKIMIVLTDGEPSEGDLRPEIGIEVAQKMGIKIYTIGIGSEEDKMFMHPFYGLVPMPKVNRELLEKIANSTGGKSFMGHNVADMRAIYDTIDQLEKTKHETPFFVQREDLYQPYALGALIVLVSELFFSSIIWFAL